MFPSNREKRAVQAIMGVLGSAVKVWHCGAAELLGRLIINPDNEPFLLPFVPQVKIFPKKKRKKNPLLKTCLPEMKKKYYITRTP